MEQAPSILYVLHIWNQWPLCSRLSFFRNRLYINLRIRIFFFSFVTFPRRCNACTIWICTICTFPCTLFRAQRFLHLCVSSCARMRMHSRIDRSGRTSFEISISDKSHVDVTRAYARFTDLSRVVPPTSPSSISIGKCWDTWSKNEKIS